MIDNTFWYPFWLCNVPKINKIMLYLVFKKINFNKNSVVLIYDILYINKSLIIYII